MEKYTQGKELIMFRINGTYPSRIGIDGIARPPSTFDQHVNTEKGVMVFIKENGPFATVTVTDTTTKEDKTKYFLGG